MDSAIKRKAREQNLSEKTDYHLEVDVGQGVAMPDDSKYSLKVTFRGA